MTSSNFEEHRQKYVGFGIIAIFVIIVSYAVYRSDALSFPRRPELFLQNQRIPGCPPTQVLLRIRDRLPPNHPCRAAFEEEEQPVVVDQQQVSAPSVETSTSTATTTPETSTSTETVPSDAPSEPAPAAE